MVNFCEFDKYAAKSYCAIHGTSETLNLGDITKVDEREIEPFNMICGGSPCQDFSLAGKQAGAGCQTSMGNLRKCKKYCRKKIPGYHIPVV